MRWRTLSVACLLVVAGCAGFPVDSGTQSAPTDGQQPTTDGPQTPSPTRVVVEDENGTRLGNVTVELAETPDERYTGLSEHESLGEDEGMLFVYGSEATRTFVMRSMSFPIDIVFVGANGRITQIHHATVEDDNEDLTRYNGVGRWVLEVPYNWTTEHGVEVGDRVRVRD
jgi:uncharacterized membrane protein (UPF0127 family)